MSSAIIYIYFSVLPSPAVLIWLPNLGSSESAVKPKSVVKSYIRKFLKTHVIRVPVALIPYVGESGVTPDDR